MIRSRYRALLASIVEEWRALARHPSIFVVLLGLPIIYPTVVSYLYSSHQAAERGALVVDQDNSALSREVTLHLDATRDVRVVGRPETLEEGIAQIREQRAEMLVLLPAGLERQVKRGEQGRLRVWVDSGNVYTYGLAYTAFNNVLIGLNRELGRHSLQERGTATLAAERHALPLGLEERPVFHPTGTYGDFLVTGVLLIVVQQLVLIGLSYSVGWAREDGHRDAVGFAFTRMEGRALAQLAFHVAGIALIVFAVFPLFGWPAQSQVAVYVLFALLAVAMIPPAILAASLAPDRYVAFQLLMFFSAPVFMMSGFSWPLWRMPAAIQALAWIFPATPALSALRILSMKSGSLASVAPQLAALGAQFAAWTLLALAVVRWRARRRAKRAADAVQVPLAA